MRRKARRWIGVDGEGVGREPHRYVLLACSDGDYVESRRGLSTVDCLEFLLDLGTRDARLCGYYLSYDWTKILQDLTRSKSGRDGLHALFRPELRARQSGSFSYVQYKQYELHWLAGAMWIRDVDRGRKVTVWDLGKYYQGPFCTVDSDGKPIGALVDWKIRPELWSDVAGMKARRAIFTWRQIKQIRKYCMDECEALAEFADAVEKAHLDADLKPRGWFGPGSTASVLLKRHEIHEKRGIIPPVMLEPVACAFIGGRAEISRLGFIPGPVHGYDISSAYPDHATRLPCLEHGRWERVTRERALKGAGVVHALVHGHIRDCRGAWAPLPVRLAKGSIVFPSSGASGWWWRDEWLAARKGWKGLKFDHAYVLRRECDCQPFAFIPELFERRRLVGKDTGEGKVLKLALNSLYGKLAQSIGAAQYASRVWAGMITSGTRAQVLRLMLQHERLDSILMIATDGLFSTEGHEADFHAATASSPARGAVRLGGWEHAEHESMTLFRPGMYWLGKSKLRARGLGRDQLNAGKAILATALEEGASRVVLPKRAHFGGAKQCVVLRSGKIEVSDVYGQWHQRSSNMSLAPGPKRAPDWSPPTLSDVDSAPYGTRNTAQTGEFLEFLEAIRDYFN